MKELFTPGRTQGVNEKRLPTRTEAVWFEFRAACFRAKRGLQELNGRAPKRLRRLALATDSHLVAESRTVLYNSASPAEFALQAGKVQNLRVSARHLNGIIIPAGEVFSLWKNLGRATQRRGFVVGRELREGCVIPNIGGGLCQLSNALYDVALRAGCEIVERHSHTQALPGSTTAVQKLEYVDELMRSLAGKPPTHTPKYRAADYNCLNVKLKTYYARKRKLPGEMRPFFGTTSTFAFGRKWIASCASN